METFAFELPTFYGDQSAARDDGEEFASPGVPVLAVIGSGLRIILGTQDSDDCERPDVLIERRTNGWAMFIHPDSDGPSAVIYLHDDGRTFCCPERYTDKPLQIVDDCPDEVDGLDERGVR
jgi:hypothetical protein